jgi:hypothetical protein
MISVTMSNAARTKYRGLTFVHVGYVQLASISIAAMTPKTAIPTQYGHNRRLNRRLVSIIMDTLVRKMARTVRIVEAAVYYNELDQRPADPYIINLKFGLMRHDSDQLSNRSCLTQVL